MENKYTRIDEIYKSKLFMYKYINMSSYGERKFEKVKYVGNKLCQCDFRYDRNKKEK